MPASPPYETEYQTMTAFTDWFVPAVLGLFFTVFGSLKL
jgi:hypothetical protein